MCKRIILLFVSVSLFGSVPVESCTAAVGLQQRNFKSPAEQEDEDVNHEMVNIVVQSRLGPRAAFKAYDNKHYIGQNGGPVGNGEELACTFESTCCWTNSPPTNTESLSWNVVDQNIDAKTFAKSLQNAERPNGKFLMATSPVKRPKAKAEFVSCDILCNENEGAIAFRHWTTPKVKLEVCTEAAFVNGAVTEVPTVPPITTKPKKKQKEEPKTSGTCHPVPEKSAPGPTIIKIPPGEYFVIKFVASNFVDKGGSMAILDDIIVNTTCSRAASLQPATPGIPGVSNAPIGQEGQPANVRQPGANAVVPESWPRTSGIGPSAPRSLPSNPVQTGPWPRSQPSLALIKSSALANGACEKLTCDFEGTLCGYVDGIGSISNRAVHYLHGPVGNQTLRIEGPAQGKTYVGAVLRPGDSIALEASNLTISQESVLRFQAFKSMADLKLCFNSVTNCPFSTSQGGYEDGLWQESSVKVPVGTRLVYFIGENKGDQMGAVGLDDIALLSGTNEQSEC